MWYYIIDTVVSGTAGMVAYHFYSFAKECASQAHATFPAPEIPNVYRWSKVTDFYCSHKPLLSCPKCCHSDGLRGVKLKICECDEFYKDHFHHKCEKCEYSYMIRTADDK